MMGFLHKLWDETLAGPAPETGLGKLRKYDSFPARSALVTAAASSAAARNYHNNNNNGINDDLNQEINITRSITIIRTTKQNLKNICVDPGSAPDTPVGPATPGTPFSPGTPHGDFRRFTRRNSSAEAFEQAEPRSPTVYDWIVISALDR